MFKLVSEITQTKHFDQHLDTRIVCDASTARFCVSLEEKFSEGWVAIACATRFLNSLEKKDSVNELELLGVVWAIEHINTILLENTLPSLQTIKL